MKSISIHSVTGLKQPPAWDAAFRTRLNELGWVSGQNIRIDYRWGVGSVDRLQVFANELVRLNPEVMLAVTTPATAALQPETRTIPIVFAIVSADLSQAWQILAATSLASSTSKAR